MRSYRGLKPRPPAAGFFGIKAGRRQEIKGRKGEVEKGQMRMSLL
jgi:hypothetical protein